VQSGPELATSEVNLAFDSTTGTSMTGTFNFTLKDNKTFTGPAVYSYIVKEEVPTGDDVDKSITYDTNEYKVYVIVDNKNTVTAVVNVSEDQTVAKKPITFNNSCATDSLTITKVVTGAMGSLTDQFDFRIIIPVEGTEDGGHTIAEGTKYTGTITRAKAGSAEETVDIVVKNEADLGETENVVKLANGDSITITGLPEATIYTIKELGATDYTTSIMGTTKGKDENGLLVTKENPVDGKVYDASNTPIVNGGNTVTFTNSKGITPTGLVLTFGPQLLVLLIAVGGALVIFKTRKKRA
jgi:hypothetical protein